MACAVLLAITAYVATRAGGLQRRDVHRTRHRRQRRRVDASGASLQAAHPAGMIRTHVGTGLPTPRPLPPSASQRGLSERAVTIALATAMQESQLRNIAHGDRDSVGLFQQRPSQGWGNVEQIQGPRLTRQGEFYDPPGQGCPATLRLPLTVAAQRVQRSGFPQAYTKHERNADAADRRPHRPLMPPRSPAGQAERTWASRATRSTIRKRLVREFGRDVLSDGTGAPTAPRRTAARRTPRRTPRCAPPRRQLPLPPPGPRPGVRRGVRYAPPHMSRRTPPPAPRPSSPSRCPRTAGARGWELAHWAVANATGLHIERISFRRPGVERRALSGGLARDGHGRSQKHRHRQRRGQRCGAAAGHRSLVHRLPRRGRPVHRMDVSSPRATAPTRSEHAGRIGPGSGRSGLRYRSTDCEKCPV